MPPPLGLLQGFNITSKDSMSNLIAVINKEFEFSFDIAFKDSDFKEVFETDDALSGGVLEEFASFADDIVFSTKCKHGPDSGAVETFLSDCDVEFSVVDRTVVIPGISLPLHSGTVEVKVDPSVFGPASEVVERLIPFLAGKEFPGYYDMALSLRSPFQAIEALHKVSARIFNSELSLGKGEFLSFRSLRLLATQRRRTVSLGYSRSPARRTVPAGVDVKIFCEQSSLVEAPIGEALRALMKTGIIYIEGAE